MPRRGVVFHFLLQITAVIRSPVNVMNGDVMLQAVDVFVDSLDNQPEGNLLSVKARYATAAGRLALTGSWLLRSR